MHRFAAAVITIASLTNTAFAPTQTAGPAPTGAKPATARNSGIKEPLVEFEMMTWPEVKKALAGGKTTALFYTGGTEPQLG